MTAVVIPAYLTLREHEVVLILRSVVKMSGDVVSCLLSEFHWPKSGVSGKNDFGLLQDSGQNGQSRGRRLRTIGLDFGFGSSGGSSLSPSNTRCGTARTRAFSAL